MEKHITYDMGEKLNILYVMPFTAGDILQSTAVCKRIKEKFINSVLFFGTNSKYMELLEGCPYIDHIVEYDTRMDIPDFINEIFDITYTPHLYLQRLGTNWVHKGKTDKNIIHHFCWHSDVSTENFYRKDFYFPVSKFDIRTDKKIICIISNDGHVIKAKRYSFWQDIIDNLDEVLDGSEYILYQCGTVTDKPLKTEKLEIVDLRGKTSLRELNYIISKASIVISVDSYPIHAAAIAGTPHIGLYGSTSYKQSAPVYLEDNVDHVYIQSPESCLKYKEMCYHEYDRSCIDFIDPEVVFRNIIRLLNNGEVKTFYFIKKYPTISGYIYVGNAEKRNYPFIESIKSLCGFCDEVIVAYSSSGDKTKEMLFENFGSSNLVKIHEVLFTPTMYIGEAKAFARALCTKDFCFQLDCDEVVHEEDYDKIKEILRFFPEKYDILSLPVIDYFWGDHISSDYHCWKWRISRNKKNITHGIPKPLQRKHSKTGKICSVPGLSDAENYIDIVTEEQLDHYNNFYTYELDLLRRENPNEYLERVIEIFKKYPSIRHYSWWNLENKIKQFDDFWDEFWANLYDQEPKRRFTGPVKEEVKNLIKRGGCHDGGVLLYIGDRITHPAVMEHYLSINKPDDVEI